MAIGDTPRVMNHTRGALCGGKCGERGRGGFDDDGAALVMMGRACDQTSRRLMLYVLLKMTILCMALTGCGAAAQLPKSARYASRICASAHQN
jgi:hypothetical protein